MLGVLRFNNCFLTASGMKQPLVYQIIFRNLIKIAGPCTVCGAMDHPIFASNFVLFHP